MDIVEELRAYREGEPDALEQRAADEIERLRRDCAEAYQVCGSVLIGDPVLWTEDDGVRVLDNLSAAANGMPRVHDDLLPWPLMPNAVFRRGSPKASPSPGTHSCMAPENKSE